MLICPNKNSTEYKSWEQAGIPTEQIYAEYVLNNYALPVYSQSVNKALTIPEIRNVISQYSSLSKLGIKDISSLQHQNVNAVGAYFKDVLYFSDRANQKTISEETGHAMLQKFADPKTHKLVMLAGKQLLENRLEAEGRTLNEYLKSIQEELGVSESKAEEYAQEEEFMKDYAFYDSTGTQAQDLRRINELAEKLSFLGTLANKVAKVWVNLIKGLKQLFGKPDELTHALELIRSLKQSSQAKYDRGYNVPSFMYIRKGESSVGVSPFSIQKMLNDVAATYYNRYKDENNFIERVEEIFNDFADYYDDLSDKNPNSLEYNNLFFASTALENDWDTTDEVGNVKLSTREEALRVVRDSLKVLGVKISEDMLEDSEFETKEDEQGGRQSYDLDSNQKTIESLSLGLKNIILRVGEVIDIGGGKSLTFAPDVSHIYSGLVRYSSKAYNTTDRFKRMVEFSDFDGNNSSKLLIQNYFLKQFTVDARYNGKEVKEVSDWVSLIKSDDFDFNKIAILNPILAQEFVVLVKGLELVSRDMRTMKITFGENITKFMSFDTNSNGVSKKLEADYTDKLNVLANKFKNSREEYTNFLERNKKTTNNRDFLIEIFKEADIRLTERVKQEIRTDTSFGERTNLSKLELSLRQAVDPKEDKPLVRFSEDIKDAGSLNSLIAQVINLQIEYDETILENSFSNMDGKTIYAFQRQTPIILTLRNLANETFLKKFENGSPYIGQNNIWSNPGFKDNPIVKVFLKLDEKAREAAAKTFSLDGLFSEESGFRDQVSFSDMDDRHFAASALNLMVSSTNLLERKVGIYTPFTAVTLGQNEASSLIDFNNVPVFSKDEIQENLKLLIKQEVDRIKLIKAEIEAYIPVKIEKEKKAEIAKFKEDSLANSETGELSESQLEQLNVLETKDRSVKNTQIKITYEELKDYYRDKGMPVYKGMLDGTYVIKEDGKINVKETSELSKNLKSFQITKNLKDILYLDDILVDVEGATISDETVKKANDNLENVLQIQLEALIDMGVMEILDNSITNHIPLSQKQIADGKVQLGAAGAFNFTRDANNNIKNLLRQFWMGSTFTNQILVGDPSISFKNDLKDILKRHRPYNAALLGVNIPFSVPSLNIFPKSEVKMILTESDTDEVFGGEKIDKDDAQSYSSLDFWLYKKFSKGKLTKSSYEVYLDVQAGIKPTNKQVEEADAYFASDKTVSAQGNQIVKHSEHHILPYDVAQVKSATLLEAQEQGYTMNPVSRKLEPINELGQITVKNSPFIYVGREIENGDYIINRLEPMEHLTKHFNLFAMLQGYSYKDGGWKYSGPVDIKSPTTATKGAQKNVLNIANTLEEYSINPEYYVQSLAANTYGDQVENPPAKKKTIDPSQNQEIKINEIEKAQDLVEEYLQNHAQRNDFEIDLVMKELYGSEYNTAAELDAKQFLDALTRLLKESDTDYQKLDFFSYKQIGEKFVANYNLNLPPIRQKFTQSLFKMFTRALKHKVAGNSMVQVSPSNYRLIKRFKVVKDVTVTMPDGTKEKRDIPTWDVVTYDEYLADKNRKSVEITNKETNKIYKYSGKNAVEQKPDELTSELLKEQEASPDNTIYFFDEVRFMKPYINESNELEFFVSEAVMPKWFDSSEDIPDALKLQYGVRIPSQDKQTSVAIEWVSAFGPEMGNSIIVPKEIIFISGSDFDIDKLFTQRPEGYFENGKFKLYEDNVNDFKRYMFEEKKFFKSLLSEHESYKNVSKKVREAFAKKKTAYEQFKNNKREFKKAFKENLEAQIKSLIEIADGKLKNKADIAKKAQETLRTISKIEDNINNIDFKLRESTEFNQEFYELEEQKFEEISKLDLKYTDLFNYYESIGLSEAFKSNREILENNKRIISESSEFADETREIREALELKDRVKSKVQNEILAKYNYPTTAEEYVGQTYPAIINNRQLRVSQKLLSEPEIIYTGIYETPATVQPYAEIFNNFVIIEPKNSNDAKKYDKLGYDSKPEEVDGVKTGNVIYYPFRTKKGESIFTKDVDYVQTFSLLNFSMYQKAVQAAKAGIGLLANANVLGIFGKRLKMRLNKPLEFEGKKIYEFQFKTEKERRVFDAISTTISVTTDEAKESQLSNHGISSMDLKVMSILMLHGLDIEDAFAFTRSEGAKDYNNLLARNKITRTPVDETAKKAKFSTNEGLIASYRPKVIVKDKNIKRKEFIEEGNQVLAKKYFTLYNDILGMYGELSKLIPAVKLKTGLANDVPSFLRSLKDITDSDNYWDNFNYYTIGEKSRDFKNSIDIYNRVNNVAKKELVEMNPIFSNIQTKLESSITSKKKDYSEDILKFIDQFLLGTYARKLASTQSLFENKETFRNTLMADIGKIYNKNLPVTDPFYKAHKASIGHLRTIVKTQKGEIKLNFEGKLNQKTKDLIADSWLLLKNSPIEEVRAVADGLFKYYFLKDALQYKQGSLEIIFPASKFKNISEVYDSIINSNDASLEEEFITYFAHLPDTNKFLKNYKTAWEAFGVETKEEYDKIAREVKNLVTVNGQTREVFTGIQMNPTLKNLPKLIKIKFRSYVLAPNNMYYLVTSEQTNEFNTLLTGNNRIAEFNNMLRGKLKPEAVFETVDKQTSNDVREVLKPEVAQTSETSDVNEFIIADTLPSIEQNFIDGQGGRQMQDKFKGKSTMDLIISGDRTRTTRAKTDIQRMVRDYDLSKISDIVGKVIRMTDKTGKEVYTRITKVAPFTQEYQDSTWQKEGWKKEVTDKNVGNYPYAIEFELVIPSNNKTSETSGETGGIKVISEDYGVVTVETNPSKDKTQEFINIIQPQIQKQAYQENITGNQMFMFGYRWTRKGKAKRPLNNKSYANNGLSILDAKAKDGYVYDTVDQNGNALAQVTDLQPIMDEIQNSLNIDMSNYDAVIGNIYLPGQRIATHRDTTESLSARNYPVVVYTIGNDSGITVYENEKNPGGVSFASDKETPIPTKNGSIYTFGMDGKGRFEVAHDTPKNIKRDRKFPPITMPNGDVITNYTITLTFRRAADLDVNTPTAPAKLEASQTPSTNEAQGTQSDKMSNKDTYQYFGANYTIVLDQNNKGIDIENYSKNSSETQTKFQERKQKLLDAYNNNPNVDPQNGKNYNNEIENNKVDKSFTHTDLNSFIKTLPVKTFTTTHGNFDLEKVKDKYSRSLKQNILNTSLEYKNIFNQSEDFYVLKKYTWTLENTYGSVDVNARVYLVNTREKKMYVLDTAESARGKIYTTITDYAAPQYVTYEIGLKEALSYKEGTVGNGVETNKLADKVLKNSTSLDKRKIEEKYELFPGVEANEGQKYAIDIFTDFINGKVNVNGQSTFAALLGKGGTGKSTIIKKIVGNKDVLYIAPTHKAKEILTQATGKNSITLAAALGVKPNELTGTFERVEFDKNKLQISKKKLIVIDEGSMINDEYLEIIKELILPGAKVIFMGDNHQLPPVGQETDAKIFQYKLAELKERMRQGESSPIIPITDKVADNIESSKIERDAIVDRTNNYDSESNKGVIFENSLNNAMEMWKQDFKVNPKSTKIITFNNENNNNAQSVKSLNKLARNILFGSIADEYVKGDQIMGYDQYGEFEKPDLLNSVDYTVLEASKQVASTYNITAYSRAKGNRQVPITVSGYNLTIQNNINGDISTIFALDSKSKDVVKSKVTELYNGANKDSQMAMVLSMYFPKLEHGYAITSHKSQGSTYRNVYVMEDNILGNVNGSNKTVNQSLYVAVSRPSDKLVIVSRKNPKTTDTKVEPSPDAKSIDELFDKPCDGGASI